MFHHVGYGVYADLTDASRRKLHKEGSATLYIASLYPDVLAM